MSHCGKKIEFIKVLNFDINIIAKLSKNKIVKLGNHVETCQVKQIFKK
jgi:hypothetical protein